MITDIGHAAFAAHDLDRSLAFYAQLGIHSIPAAARTAR
jgi:catechol 2,3-dioxygenase-like lactoylglutathione lyase family enzyme